MEPQTIIKYSSYTESQKRATQKYRENNKEKVNEQRKKYYEERKAKDPTFLEYKRNKAKEYYLKKKTNVIEPIPEEKESEPVESQELKLEFNIVPGISVVIPEHVETDVNIPINLVQEQIERIEKRKRNKKQKI